ncbi:MAG: CBS domain-containing protein [Cryomorphaceae bacterium]|nr:CBS domain-containing protein [Flavobacteriales bacterium]
MKKRAPVSEIMTTDLVTVDKTKHTLRDVKSIFAKGNIRHLPVLEGEKLAGIISKNDMNRLSFGTMFENQGDSDEAVLDMLSIDQVMTHHPTSISPETTIRDAAEMLVSHSFHSLPVSENGTPTGIVTSTDIIDYLLKQY